MATVSTEDIRNALLANPQIIVDLLDSDPAILEMVRSRILTPELLALPDALAQFAAEIREFAAQTNARLSSVENRLTSVEHEIVSMRGDMDNMRGDMDNMRGDMDRMGGKIDRMESSIGHLKGSFVENTARKNEDAIAHQVSVEHNLSLRIHTLATMRKSERRALMGEPALQNSDISDGDRVSFIQADHIISIDDINGGRVCIAIEASFVGDAHDARRAMRNAGLISELTGADAYGVVVGCHATDGLLEMSKRGDVIWHEVQEDKLSA